MLPDPDVEVVLEAFRSLDEVFGGSFLSSTSRHEECSEVFDSAIQEFVTSGT